MKGHHAKGVVNVGVFDRGMAASVIDKIQGGVPEKAKEQEEGSKIGLWAYRLLVVNCIESMRWKKNRLTGHLPQPRGVQCIISFYSKSISLLFDP